MQCGLCKEQLKKKKKKMVKSQEYSNCHEPLSQEWIPNLQTICCVKLRILAVAYLVTGLD